MTDPSGFQKPVNAMTDPRVARDWQCVLCRERVVKSRVPGEPDPVHECRVEARIRQIVREELDARTAYGPGVEG